MFNLAAVAKDASSSNQPYQPYHLKRKTPSEKTSSSEKAKTCTRCLIESDSVGNSQPHGRFICSSCCKELKDQFDHQLKLEGWRWQKDAGEMKDERDETIKRLESINERLRVIITQKDAKIKRLYDLLETVREAFKSTRSQVCHYETTINTKIEWLQAKKELNVEEEDDLVEDDPDYDPDYSQSE